MLLWRFGGNPVIAGTAKQKTSWYVADIEMLWKNFGF
jgi:hypothetical protein